MTKKQLYTDQEFLNAYLQWFKSSPVITIDLKRGIFLEEHMSLSDQNEIQRKRIQAWDHYCDVRDQLAPGTSRQRRLILDGQPSLH